MQEGNENSPCDKLEACAHFVNQIHTKQLRQQTITRYEIPNQITVCRYSGYYELLLYTPITSKAYN
ncbi:hypothetical protein QTP88_025815 [Uroleucon formosanum]